MALLMKTGYQTYRYGTHLVGKGTKYAGMAGKKAMTEMSAINKKVNQELGITKWTQKNQKASTDEDTPLVNVTQKKEQEELPFFEKYIQPCVAEFVGTTLFVFIGTMSTQDELLLATAIAHGLALALLIFSLGSLSGGHFNPVVSLAVGLSNGLPWVLVPCYILAQLSGSLLGAGIMRGCLSFGGNVTGLADNSTVYYKVMGGATTLNTDPSYQPTIMAGILTESVLTFLLVLTVLVTSVDTKTKMQMNGLAIGLSVAVSIIAGGPITGASMNPARSFGPAVVVTDLRREVWRYHYIYWVGPLLGAGLATALYRLFLASKDRRPVKFPSLPNRKQGGKR